MKVNPKNQKITESEKAMKNKKLIVILGVVLCLVAIASFGTLAWFTANDSVTNNFYIANSEDDADEIFSVDVWEDDDEEDPDGDEKWEEMALLDIQPGDIRFKEVHIENTGYYDQYIRATVTITGASVWRDVYGVHLVPLSAFANYDASALYHMDSYYDAAEDAFVYQLYYDKAIAADQEIIVFDEVTISEALTREQAAELSGEFKITVYADAVQTANVGDNVYEAFKTVGLVKALPIADAADLAAALAREEELYLIIDAAALTNGTLIIDGNVKDKVLDFNGSAANVLFTANATAENLVISGIKDDDANGVDIKSESNFTGDVLVLACDLISNTGTGNMALQPISGNFVFEDCSFTGASGKTYCLYNSGATTGDLSFVNCEFNKFSSWAIQVNNAINGSVVITGCTFNTPDGVFKALGGVSEDFTFVGNTMIGVKGHDGKPEQIMVSTSANVPVIAGGVKTVANNTLDGVDWTQA